MFEGDRPNVEKALDYLGYLHELLDEVPLLGWEVVREAHGEILRLVEQCRLKWDNVVERGKAVTKALRRARLQDEERKALKAAESKVTNANKKPCPQYQTNECSEKGTHSKDWVTWLHCCTTCPRVKKN